MGPTVPNSHPAVLAARLEGHAAQLKDHEERIRPLEAFSSRAVGAMLALSTFGSLIGGLLAHFLSTLGKGAP